MLQFMDEHTSIGVLLTFLASALSFYYSRKISKAGNYVDTITKNRIEWLYKLRELIAEYISLVMANSHCDFIHDRDKLSKHFIDIKKCSTNIKLMLNYNDEIDSKVIIIIEDLEENANDMYGCLFFVEQYMDDEKTDEEKKELIVTDEFASKYLIKYLKDKGIKINHELNIFNRGLILRNKMDELLSVNDFIGVNFTLSLLGQMSIIREEINKNIKLLTKEIQVYLKFEWNRVKNESKGKVYDKAMQDYDLKQLYELYDDSNYKISDFKKFFVLTKCKTGKLIKGVKWFAIFGFFSLVITFLILSVMAYIF